MNTSVDNTYNYFKIIFTDVVWSFYSNFKNLHQVNDVKLLDEKCK